MYVKDSVESKKDYVNINLIVVVVVPLLLTLDAFSAAIFSALLLNLSRFFPAG